ncbi:MAG: CopG family transcriptional regulator [Wenzhouxiangellaceae bacterium]
MPRTLINLEPDDKQWLDAEARARGVSMASLVREAVHEYRVHEQATRRPTLEEALADTAGIWRGGDGLAWQRRLRDEWTRDE